jgi:hypothetical protein
MGARQIYWKFARNAIALIGDLIKTASLSALIEKINYIIIRLVLRQLFLKKRCLLPCPIEGVMYK